MYGYERVQQHDWVRPLRGDWIARLQDVVLGHTAHRDPQAAADIILVGHSLGCLLVAAWAAQTQLAHHIRGALLVAPGDPQREELVGNLGSWAQIPQQTLPFPSLLLGSQDDPYCSCARAQAFASAWGSRFIDYGLCGHINADSGLGDWPQGHELLTQLADLDANTPRAVIARHQEEG